MKRLLAIGLGVGLVFSGAPATAADPVPNVAPSVPAESFEDRSELDRRIAELRSERDAIRTRGPRAAVIAGGVMTGVGAMVGVVAALACVDANSGSDTRCREDRATGIGVGGGVVAVVGLVTLVSGLTKLSERRRRRRALDHRILELERERSAEPGHFSARLRVGRRNTLTLSWTF